MEIDIIIIIIISKLYMEQTTSNLIRNAFLRAYYNLTFLFLENFHFMQLWMFSPRAFILDLLEKFLIEKDKNKENSHFTRVITDVFKIQI